jgi:hypothetical protein
MSAAETRPTDEAAARTDELLARLRALGAWQLYATEPEVEIDAQRCDEWMESHAARDVLPESEE